jgi:hypothetical protein
MVLMTIVAFAFLEMLLSLKYWLTRFCSVGKNKDLSLGTNLGKFFVVELMFVKLQFKNIKTKKELRFQ